MCVLTKYTELIFNTIYWFLAYKTTSSHMPMKIYMLGLVLCRFAILFRQIQAADLAIKRL